MTYTYDTSTNAGKVRLLINDHDEQNVIFQDEEMDVFLALNGDDVYLAAAMALETIASNQVMVLKVITVMDLQTDGAAVARALREHAKSLREQATQADAASGEAFDIAEMTVDVFTARQRIRNQALRDQL